VTLVEHPDTAHVPRRLGWDCVACRQAWPCAPAKADLVEEYAANPGLVFYLALQLTDAVSDLDTHTGPAPSNLYERFIGWVPRPGPESLTTTPGADPHEGCSPQT
jgi:hypothetical protein